MRDIVSPLDGFASPFGPQRGFNPLRLFAASEPGVWYDPSDLDTLFQDTAGTTPVTAPGQTVALALDKSQGLALEPELADPLDLTDGSWSIAGTGTITGASTFSMTTNGGARGGGLLTVGKFYRLTLNITSTAFLRLYNTNGTQLNLISNIGTGSNLTLTATFLAVDANLYFRFDGAGDATVNSLSIRELPGYHATQATAAARPTYGIVPKTGRRNLLVNTPFAGAVAGSPGTPPTSWVPDINNGTISTPSTGVLGVSSTAQRTVFRQNFTVPANATRTWSAKVNLVSGSVDFRNVFDFSSAAGPTYTYTINGASAANTSSIPLGENVLTVTVENDGTERTIGGRLGLGLLSNQTASAEFSEPQFEEGSTATAYQKVVTQYEVTEAGVPSLGYLSFDGVDDFLVTPTITPGTDKAQVFAGVRKLSDAAAIIAETSTSIASNAGTFYLAIGDAGGREYSSASRGTAAATSPLAAFDTTLAPDTAVLAATHDIAGDLSTLRRNGVAGTNGTGDKGAGNFLAYPMYIGARAGTSTFFNGHIYSLITRFGPNLETATIESTDTYVNNRTGAY